MWKFQISIFYSEYNIDDISNVLNWEMYHFKRKNKLILNFMASTHLKKVGTGHVYHCVASLSFL